jgi:putative FmdB family regulatory protein
MTRKNCLLEIIRRTCYRPFMPIYEFHCEKCGKDSEIIVRSTDWTGAKCPHCASKKLTKKMSAFAQAGAESNAHSGHDHGNGGGGHCCGGCGCH